MHAPEVFLRKLKRVRDSRMIAGFTLLEAMIALMIVAVALPAFSHW
jgi:prepilin-type N-terminal cleavage/methylation domain-containing protein